MEFNYFAILIAVVAQFLLGFLWYGPIFGKLWGKMHGFDKLSKETQQKMMKAMGPFYALQLFVTVITTFVLDIFINFLPNDWNIYALAGFFWLGFVLPTQVSGVIFGGTEGKWIAKKIAVQAGGALVCLEAAAIILHFFS
jgi:hypothetical protein